MTAKMRTLVWNNLCAIIMDKSRQKFTHELWKITQSFPLGHFQISLDTSLFWRFTHFSDDNKKTWSHDFIYCSHWSKCLQYSASFLKQHRRQQYLSIIFSELSREIKETNHSYQNPHSSIRQKKLTFFLHHLWIVKNSTLPKSSWLVSLLRLQNCLPYHPLKAKYNHLGSKGICFLKFFLCRHSLEKWNKTDWLASASKLSFINC